jgi:hypothetical protein
MVKIWALVKVEVTRLLRDRSNLFFVFLFPLLLIIFIGAQFGSDFSTRLGVVAERTATPRPGSSWQLSRRWRASRSSPTAPRRS